MLRKALPALVTVAALASAQAHADDKLILKSMNVDLPFGDRMFPDGPGSDVVNGNCLACHSAGMVLTQPALSPAQWRAEVEKMRTAYAALLVSETRSVVGTAALRVVPSIEGAVERFITES